MHVKERARAGGSIPVNQWVGSPPLPSWPALLTSQSHKRWRQVKQQLEVLSSAVGEALAKAGLRFLFPNSQLLGIPQSQVNAVHLSSQAIALSGAS